MSRSAHRSSPDRHRAATVRLTRSTRLVACQVSGPSSSATGAPRATDPSTRWPPTSWPPGSAPTTSSPTSSPPPTACWSPGTNPSSARPPTSRRAPSSPTGGRPASSRGHRGRAGSSTTSPSPSCAPCAPSSGSRRCARRTPASTGASWCRPSPRSSTYGRGCPRSWAARSASTPRRRIPDTSPTTASRWNPCWSTRCAAPVSTGPAHRCSSSRSTPRACGSCVRRCGSRWCSSSTTTPRTSSRPTASPPSRSTPTPWASTRTS